MSARILTESDRQRRLAQRQLITLAEMNMAIRVVTKRARDGLMDLPRALALIEALLDRHAVARMVPTSDPKQSRLTIVASDTAPPSARALLEQAQLPKLDPAEQDMIQRLQVVR
jgi:hypothetical protein